MGGDQGLTGPALAGLLEAQGYDFFTGVPCSMIEGLIATLETHPRLPYVPAVREDVAVGARGRRVARGPPADGADAELGARHEHERAGVALPDVPACPRCCW